VKRGIELFTRSVNQTIIGVSPSHSHPMWTYKIIEDYLAPFIEEEDLDTRSQDLTPAYTVNGSFYLISPESLRLSHSFFKGKMIPLLIESQFESIDIDTEEDFKKSSLDYTKASYSIAASIVKAVTGTRENVYEEYKKIIELAKIQKKDRNDKRKLEKPESANLFEKDNDNDFIIYEFQGRKIPVCTVMPRKGNASSEDFFVFQKNNPAVQ
ncbi:MAG: hypothetical protein WCJ59_01980, partial [bacterium]